MATTSENPGTSFRLGMLIYDTRYRSITIQIVFLFLFMAGFAWLVDNTLTNLADKGKDIDFSFLGMRAGYDINQRLVDYTNDSSHARAWIVGLLNTLVLAFCACVTATVIGVIAGVLRLSKNWIVSKLMTLYVELFRNVPLLLWIIVIFAVLTEVTPAPNAFRGETPSASMMLFDSVAVTNRGTYVPSLLFGRSLGDVNLGLMTVSMNYFILLFIIVGSIWGYRKLQRDALKQQEATGARPTTWWKSALVLIAPLLIALIAMGTHLEYPALKGFNFRGGGYIRNSFIAMWLALTVYTGAFIAENVRSGILAVSRGQSEAAFALGLRPGRTMSLVVLPQALRVIIPPLISQYLNITKNTSLALAVGYMDLRATLGGITLNQTGRELESMLLMMLTYLVISLLISGGMNVYNNAVKLKER
ncbi:ABC transporter permease subunit [Pseudorhodobacter turbinis]|uniref:ABC transporter permease subunit n=1 Tax=Pseudorhodobacter turbinis TaxID=2500533 RepID=A0A4P8EE08_9RHOB|nr:ABC transporter permease subunit [Pseudorhodobacter turbinis]QCO55251.1 ABC transporter permease subunit [Pseudorhodobacter turbinis]